MDSSIFKEDEKKKVEVVLLGQRLALRSDRGEQYLQKLANFVADQIEDIRKGSRSVSTHQSVLLIALKLADMLKQKEDELFELRDSIRNKASNALNDVETALGDLQLKPEPSPKNEPNQTTQPDGRPAP
ncbi:MAG: cell division protein ZapA [Myxococcales bacterium]|nr:cell division protein ZapA [Myxococcales bacterium]USN50998.1 MAG: cell division protein ZapA [Myxococcales bacterium]